MDEATDLAFLLLLPVCKMNYIFTFTNLRTPTLKIRYCCGSWTTL